MPGKLNHSRSLSLVVILAVLGLLSAPVATMAVSTTAQDATGETTVEIVDFAFSPATLTVPAGTTVIWTNTGSAPHTVTAEDGSFDSGQLGTGDSFQQTFDTPGEFPYFCAIHPRMQAVVIVTAEEGEPSEPAEPAEPEQPEQPDQAEQPDPTDADPAGEAALAEGARHLAPVEEPRLAHIHAGTCEELGIVVYSFDRLRSYLIDAEGEPVELVSGSANVPLTDLFNEPFSVHVHESEENKQVYLACAEVGARPGGDWSEEEGLTLRVDEQFDSGFEGVVTLQPGPAGETRVDLFLSAPGEAAAPAAEAEPARPAGTTYTSPTYGYSLTYGPNWEETENLTTGTRDRFVLFNGTSYVVFTAVEGFNGDPQACVDGFVSDLSADPNVSNLELATDEDGNPARGGTEATGAFAVYEHDYTFPDRVDELTLFVGCIPLVEGEAVLAVVQNVPTDEYQSQIEPREALFRSLVLPQ